VILEAIHARAREIHARTGVPPTKLRLGRELNRRALEELLPGVSFEKNGGLTKLMGLEVDPEPLSIPNGFAVGAVCPDCGETRWDC
jgi:hypothetical protein